MEVLTLKLDPDTREELYSDVHTNVIDFILLEALNLAGKEIIENPNAMVEALGDDEFHLNDPFIDTDEAVRSILYYLEEIDKSDGVDTSNVDYEQFYEMISDKLNLAMASLTRANPSLTLVNFYELMQNPKYHSGMDVSGSHLGNLVILTLKIISRGPFNA